MLGLIFIGLSIAAGILSYPSGLFVAICIVGVINLWAWGVMKNYGPYEDAPPGWVIVHVATSLAIVGLFIGSFFVK